MSTNLTDVAVTPTPPPMGEATPSVATETPSPNVGLDTAEKGAEAGTQVSQGVATPDVPDYLKDVPTMDELEQNKSERYAQALLGLRPAHEALLENHRTLTTQVDPFRPLIEKYQTPEQLQTKLDIVDGFFSPVLDENQQPVYDAEGLPQTTAKPGLERLAQTSPDTLFQILEDALPLEVDGAPIGNRVLAYLMTKWGLNPANISQYREWDKTGAPIASTVDLSNIPEQNKAAFQNLPPFKQRDIALLLSSENTDDQESGRWDLQQAQERYDALQTQTQVREQSARDAQVKIEQATETVVQGKFEQGFNQFLQTLSSWKPTAVETVNEVYRFETASALVNLLDKRMTPINNRLYQALGMQPNAEILKLNQDFQQQTALVETYKARNESFKAAESQRSADSAYMRLVAQLNGIAAKLIEHKSKVGEEAEAAERLNGQQGRQSVNGQPAALASNGRGGRDWVKNWYDN